VADETADFSDVSLTCICSKGINFFAKKNSPVISQRYLL